jgi:uncharacterized protein (DUF302 family)
MFMKAVLRAVALTLVCTLPVLAQQERKETGGIVSIPSNHSVVEAINRLETDVKSRGMIVFARIDFAADAEQAGLQLPPKQLLIFGNPKAGTPLMVAAPSVALDLPLKVLAWEDSNGKTWLSYNSPEYLKERHGLTDELVKNIAGITLLVKKASEK